MNSNFSTGELLEITAGPRAGYCPRLFVNAYKSRECYSGVPLRIGVYVMCLENTKESNLHNVNTLFNHNVIKILHKDAICYIFEDCLKRKNKYE